MTENRKREYDKAYMDMAEVFSKLSQAKRHKVGCLIVSEEGQILSQGYNGMPKGMDNCCEYIDEDGIEHTKPEVMHAETNAILKCAKDGTCTKNAKLYVTLSPCLECAKVIIQAGIREIYYKELYRNLDGLELLKKSGISIHKI